MGRLFEDGTQTNWLNWLGWIVGAGLFVIGLLTAALTFFRQLDPQAGATVSSVLLILGPASTQLQRIQVFIRARQKAKERQLKREIDRKRELDALTEYRNVVREAKGD